MWEVGILLMGIGVLILCIFAATTIRDAGSAIKNTERILIDKKNELEMMIDSTSKIMQDVEVITNRVNNLTNLSGIVSTVSGIFKKDNNDDILYDEEDDYSGLNFEADDEELREKLEKLKKEIKKEKEEVNI